MREHDIQPTIRGSHKQRRSDKVGKLGFQGIEENKYKSLIYFKKSEGIVQSKQKL